MLKAVVLISGGGSNLKAILEATENPEYPVSVLAVGSDNDCDGLAHADNFGVPSFVVSPGNFENRAAWAEELLSQIQGFKPDIVILAGFMRILPPAFVRALSPNLINTHPSLLPLYPGAHGVHDAMVAGAKETGVTIHIVDEGVDTGPHLAQAKVEILPEDTEESLHERIKVIERQLLVQVVANIASGTIQLSAK